MKVGLNILAWDVINVRLEHMVLVLPVVRRVNVTVSVHWVTTVTGRVVSVVAGNVELREGTASYISYISSKMLENIYPKTSNSVLKFCTIPLLPAK